MTQKSRAGRRGASHVAVLLWRAASLVPLQFQAALDRPTLDCAPYSPLPLPVPLLSYLLSDSHGRTAAGAGRWLVLTIPRLPGPTPYHRLHHCGTNAPSRNPALSAHTLPVGLHRQARWYASSTRFVRVLLTCSTDGQLFLIFLLGQAPQFPVDGIMYQDREQRHVVNVGQGRVRALPLASLCTRLVLSIAGTRSHRSQVWVHPGRGTGRIARAETL